MNVFTDAHPWTGARPSLSSPASSVSRAYGQAVAWGEPARMWMVANHLGSWFILVLGFFLEMLGMQTWGLTRQDRLTEGRRPAVSV